jgi:hypothetical protein
VDDFSLAGYDVDQLIGFGGSGEVWRARELATGQVVALKRLRGATPTSTEGDPLRREAALLASVQHEHVVVLRAVVPTDEGLVLVLDYASGGSLAALLAARGRLSAGEVVTIGAPLAQALSDVHARGVTHGDITPSNIVFNADGKPLLADLGVARLAGEGGPSTGATPGYADPAIGAGWELPARIAGPAGDIHGLAAVCFRALAGVVAYPDGAESALALAPLAGLAPPRLVAAIEAGLDPDPAVRPTADAFARELYGSCSPEPVRLIEGATAPADTPVTAQVLPLRGSAAPPPAAGTLPRPTVVGGGHRRRWWSSDRRRLAGRIAVVGVAFVLLGGAIAGGIGWAAHDHRALATTASTPDAQTGVLASAAPSASASVASGDSSAVVGAGTDWSAVLAGLDRERAHAFTSGDPTVLAGVYVAGSTAFATDVATLHQLQATGRLARGLRLRINSVQVLTQSAAEVSLRVHDTLDSYQVVSTGTNGAAVPVVGRGDRAWLVILRAQPPPGGDGPLVDQRWRIASIAPA